MHFIVIFLVFLSVVRRFFLDVMNDRTDRKGMKAETFVIKSKKNDKY